jgi:hypothetical protein
MCKGLGSTLVLSNNNNINNNKLEVVVEDNHQTHDGGYLWDTKGMQLIGDTVLFLCHCDQISE